MILNVDFFSLSDISQPHCLGVRVSYAELVLLYSLIPFLSTDTSSLPHSTGTLSQRLPIFDFIAVIRNFNKQTELSLSYHLCYRRSVARDQIGYDRQVGR